MIDYYLRMYLKKREELEEQYNSNTVSNQTTTQSQSNISDKIKKIFTEHYKLLIITFTIIGIGWLISSIIFTLDLDLNLNYYETSNLIIWLTLTVLFLASFVFISFWDNKIKNDSAERKIQNYQNIIKDLKSFFNSKGIDTNEKRQKLIEDIAKEKKFLIEEAKRPKQLLEKFLMGVVLSTFIGTFPATIQGYMDNCDKKEVNELIIILGFIFIFIITIWIILYISECLYSFSYNKKIWQYKEFEEDLNEILYIDDNIPQPVPATSP